ncbi:group II intron maturase-specific domain-containing protein [Alkalibaculum bacchi]|uniref:group II intron maturase-specific domain-containing protein n=1 Tax=Alkalibaculum bacchi TaxID=645887 RepID=UPI0014731820
MKETLKNATLYQDIEAVIKRLNRKIVGWRNYYGISPTRILMKLDKYILTRLVIWYNRKRQERKRYKFIELSLMFKDLGLKRIAFTS